LVYLVCLHFVFGYFDVDIVTLYNVEDSGWPVWTIFCQLGDCLHWAVFGNLFRSANICVTFLRRKSYEIILAKNGSGDILGDFSTNLWWKFTK
jgi:hypothetical protein